MATKPKRTMQPARARTEHIYRVESAEPYGWIVYLDGDSATHFFRSRPLALAKACEWAEANRPSLVLLSNIAGHIERHSEYQASSGAAIPG